MTPEQAIAALDRQIEAHGQSVVFRRYTASTGNPRPKTDHDCRAFVRPVKAEELVGSIINTFSAAVLSPTGFPAELLPIRKGDKLVIDGTERNIELPKPIKMNDVLVRYDLMVAG